MMIYQAALDDVPPDIIEAAMLDGANGAKRLLYVTLPMIRQTITTTLMLITLQTLSVFTLIFFSYRFLIGPILDAFDVSRLFPSAGVSIELLPPGIFLEFRQHLIEGNAFQFPMLIHPLRFPDQ